MKLSSYILISTFTFPFANFVDTIISSSDTFHWIGKIPTCFDNYSIFNNANKDISINSSVNSIISILLFAWSALMTGLPFACSTIYLCLKCCHFSTDPSKKNVHLLIILFEFFIIFSIFGPVTNINFWLRDCIPSYVVLCVSLFFYSLAIIVAMLSAKQLCIQVYDTQFNFLKCFLQAVIITLLYEVQIVACMSTFAVFFSLIMYSDDFESVYFSFAVLASISMLIANGSNRWEFYFCGINNGQHGNKCSIYLKRVVFGIATIIYCLACIILLVLTGTLYRKNERTILIISLCFLGVAIFISLSCLLFYFCLWLHQNDPPAQSDGSGESNQNDSPAQSNDAREPDQDDSNAQSHNAREPDKQPLLHDTSV